MRVGESVRKREERERERGRERNLGEGVKDKGGDRETMRQRGRET